MIAVVKGLPFPTAIDNTLRQAFVSCPTKFMRQYLQHWKLKSRSIHLTAGGAFAKGLEDARKSYWNGDHDSKRAIATGAVSLLRAYGEVPEDFYAAAKSPDTLLLALESYFHEYGWETDVLQPLVLANGSHAFEFTFALPIPGIYHPETGDPLLYSGRFDMLGVFQDQIFGTDEKTTSQLGPTWAKQWHLNSQITGYCWAAREFGYQIAGFFVRGVSVQKKEIKHMQVIEYRPQWMIERWMEQLQIDILSMIGQWKSGMWDQRFAQACSDFGGCPFQEVCSSLNPDRWLEANFEKREWNPLSVPEVGS